MQPAEPYHPACSAASWMQDTLPLALCTSCSAWSPSDAGCMWHGASLGLIIYVVPILDWPYMLDRGLVQIRPTVWPHILDPVRKISPAQGPYAVCAPDQPCVLCVTYHGPVHMPCAYHVQGCSWYVHWKGVHCTQCLHQTSPMGWIWHVGLADRLALCLSSGPWSQMNLTLLF